MPKKPVPTIDEALIWTLATTKRVLRQSLLLHFAQRRFKRQTRTTKDLTKKVLRGALASALATGTVVLLDDGRYELGAKTATKVERTRKLKAAERKKKAPPPAPKERVYFPAVALDAFEQAAHAVTLRFEVFATTADSVSFRWRHSPTEAGPDFRLERSTGKEAKRLMRAGTRLAVNRRLPKLVCFVALAFDDLDAVLDETNGLIEAQRVIATATAGPMFLAWNKRLLKANGADINILKKF